MALQERHEMTDSSSQAYAVNCPRCGDYQRVANPRPAESPQRVFPTDVYEGKPNWSEVMQMACTSCGSPMTIVLLYGSEEMLQELPPHMTRPMIMPFF